MKVFVNGQVREVAAGTSLVELLRALGLESGRVAVERNGRIVPRADHGGVVLEEGDRLEIVHFVGGG